MSDVLAMCATVKAEKAYEEYLCIRERYHAGECCESPRVFVLFGEDVPEDSGK
jgi:hypothetical protein